MHAPKVQFRFAFRCVTPNPRSVDVFCRLPDSPPIDLIRLSPTCGSFFHGESQIQTRALTRIEFQFRCTFDDHPDYISTHSYLVDEIPNTSVLISDIERTGELRVTLRFKINYQTTYGQNVYIVGSLPDLGLWSLSKGVLMTHADPYRSSGNGLFSDTRFNWQCDIRLPKPPGAISYKYVVQSHGSPPRIETGGLRYLTFDDCDYSANYEFNDIWRWDEFVQNMSTKRFFDDAFCQRSGSTFPPIALPDPDKIRCIFLAFSTVVTRARTLHVVGSIAELGEWNPRRGLSLGSTGDLQATGYIDVTKTSLPFEYKHVALGGNNIIQWEPNENRRATVSKWDNQECPWAVIFDSWHLNLAGVAFHGAGVFVKLSAIRDGLEVFTFATLKKIAAWANAVGFAAVHFVGLFDTTGLQPRIMELPVSGFALNPLHLDLSEYDCNPMQLDENEVLAEKLECLQKIWRKKRDFDEGVETWVQENRWWLTGYERFCAGLQTEIPENEFARFVDFVQYLCYHQLLDAVNFARDKNAMIGVDLPFALHMRCAEALTQEETQLFRTNYQLGIPPTVSNPIGRVLPAYPYNFDYAAQWFAKRLEHFGQIFDLIRLESTINFFRQYIVPLSSIRGVFGRFDPSVVITFGQLETWGLWDIDRYTQPYIREPILNEIFGNDAQDIREAFMTRRDGQIVFKPEFDTERKLVDAELDSHSDALRSKHLEGLLRLLAEVLLIEVGKSEYQPRIQLAFAPTTGPTRESYSFHELPFHQSAIAKIHDEFCVASQKCLWASTGRRNLRWIAGRPGALVLSDATGLDGEICDEALSGLGILPFRAHLEGRSSYATFDDIRDYPYFSIAAPTKDLSCSLREVWKTKRRKVLWEDELFERGEPPTEYNDQVAESMMKLNCWSGSMWVMFQIDSVIGGVRHMDERLPTVVNIELVCADTDANGAISRVLESSKRKV